jgi:hypothetical protein
MKKITTVFVAMITLLSITVPTLVSGKEKKPDCVDIIIMEALLATAVEACPLRWVDRGLSSVAAKCLPTMDERVSDSLARQGVDRFMEEVRAQGKAKVCSSLVEDFPKAVKK